MSSATASKRYDGSQESASRKIRCDGLCRGEDVDAVEAPIAVFVGGLRKGEDDVSEHRSVKWRSECRLRLRFSRYHVFWVVPAEGGCASS
jgi:hypothetical protein